MATPSCRDPEQDMTGKVKSVLEMMRFVWVVARRKGECEECSSPINPGDRICWDKHFHKAYCEKCGKEYAE